MTTAILHLKECGNWEVCDTRLIYLLIIIYIYQRVMKKIQ